MTRYDQLQRKMELLHKAILHTSGDMQNIWKKHLKEIVKLVNSLSIKELSEEVKMIYISGRITGNKNWEKQFQEAENYLNKLGIYTVVNPLKLEKQLTTKKTYINYMRNDIKHLINCSDIYMLRGWWRSKGARLERHIAKVLGLGIVYQKRGDK